MSISFITENDWCVDMTKVDERKKVAAVILAAGSGTRMNIRDRKQMIDIDGKTVLQHTVSVFESSPIIDSIVVVTKSEDLEKTKIDMSEFVKVKRVVSGGSVRSESARIGFLAIDGESDYVAIHDAVRCAVTEQIIASVLDSAIKYGAATAGSYIYDTVKRIDIDGNIIATLDRSELFAAHTPQIFEVGLYRRALSASGDLSAVTDDNSLLERIGILVKAVDTGAENVKITTVSDLEYSKFLLKKREK